LAAPRCPSYRRGSKTDASSDSIHVIPAGNHVRVGPTQERTEKISLLAIILIFFGIVIPVALMIFVWKIISKSDPYRSDDDPRR
jgi:hypothetical protein